ncbi:nucleotidyltransferase family protein [Erysipelothrix urinaevulpis]|uniref:nucleotidyltransferase family protein n=1 Tax=Erysipelothrix urinaevulpis TaxID=2683717 RepID=UPI001358E769|nr:nucleotidyltransferase family protein [Erysipelothrix urinaevulpis]
METNLKVCGIVVEYNPFHNGHIYHINKAREISDADVLIAAMSPNFVQRGEPAFINKWARTRAALEAGVDIVIEIPTYFVMQRADIFVESAIRLLSYLQVDTIVYGSETNEKQATPVFDPKTMSDGSSFAKASNPNNLKPNDLLGSLYEKYAQQYAMNTYTIQRTNNYKDKNLNGNIVSASAIRHNYKNKLDMSQFTPMNFSKQIHSLTDYDSLFRLLWHHQDATTLQSNLLMDEGIENLFLKHRSLPLNQLIQKTTSKRYTESKIKRTLFNTLLNHKKDSVHFPPHARILGFNEKGQTYLSEHKDHLLTCSSFKDYALKDQELNASAIYASPYSKEYYQATLQREKQAPIIIKKDNIV